MAQVTVADFERMALAAFAELREEFEEDAGLPHVQMGALARRLQQAKGEGDWDTYERGARVADQLWGGADPELRNALNVSLLENLDFTGPRGGAAWERLSPRLQRAWRAMEAYNAWLHAGARGQPPAGADV